MGLLQHSVMVFIKRWAETEKTVIPQRAIIQYMQTQGIESYRTLNAIHTLLENGYIRKAYSPQQNRTFYVLSGNISVSLEDEAKYRETRKKQSEGE